MFFYLGGMFTWKVVLLHKTAKSYSAIFVFASHDQNEKIEVKKSILWRFKKISAGQDMTTLAILFINSHFRGHSLSNGYFQISFEGFVLS